MKKNGGIDRRIAPIIRKFKNVYFIKIGITLKRYFLTQMSTPILLLDRFLHLEIIYKNKFFHKKKTVC